MTAKPEEIPQAGRTEKPIAYRRRRAWLLGAGVVLLTLGTLALVGAFFGNTAGGEGERSSGAAQVAAARTAAPVDPEARRVAARFLSTAVSRTNLDEAWELANAEMRSGVSRAQWLRGELPVAPFPVDSTKSRFAVDESYTDKVFLTVFVTPKPGSDSPGGAVYKVTLVKSGAGADARWLVSYCQPYAPPGMFVPPAS
jgi:hypothetical protein